MKEQKVFISYSWDPPQNKEWVIQLAERLVSDGVQVILDVWDLKEGQDLFQFMEQMVLNNSIKRVLIICNKEYTEKANKIKGGVGTEKQIISKEVYSKVKQEKFIPILKEKKDDGTSYLPIFINSRFGVDLSSPDTYEENYQKLVRNIYEKPEYIKPKIGTPPSYITNDETVVFLTKYKIEPIRKSLIEVKPNSQIFIDDFYETFLKEMKDLEISPDKTDVNSVYDEHFINMVEKAKYLVRDFVDFTRILIKYSISIDLDKLHHFFEEFINQLIEYRNSLTNNQALISFHIWFILNECFLYFIGCAFDKGRFDKIAFLLHNDYLIMDNHGEYKTINFSTFGFRGTGLLNWIKNQKRDYTKTFFAKLFRERTPFMGLKFEYLQQIDILLYYTSLLKNVEAPSRTYYFPNLGSYGVYNLLILRKCASLRYFNKLKVIFNVKTKEELLQKIEKIDYSIQSAYFNIEFDIPSISYILREDTIGTTS